MTDRGAGGRPTPPLWVSNLCHREQDTWPHRIHFDASMWQNATRRSGQAGSWPL